MRCSACTLPQIVVRAASHVHLQVTVQQHWTKPTTRRVKQFEKKLTQEKHQMSQEEIGRLVQQNKRKRAAA